MHPKETSDIHRRMIVHILHTASFLDAKISAELKKVGITHIQYNILKVLEHSHPTPLSVGTVKDGILFSNSDVTRLMDRLEKKGLMHRTICPQNRRQIDVEITKEGLELLNTVDPQIAKSLESFYNNKFSDDEALEIIKKMKDIRNHLSK